jgi:hypothetical protein
VNPPPSKYIDVILILSPIVEVEKHKGEFAPQLLSTFPFQAMDFMGEAVIKEEPRCIK